MLQHIKGQIIITFHRLCHHIFYVLSQTLRDDSTQPVAAMAAKHFLEHYSFPVMMVVAYPNGTIAHKINANVFLDSQPSLVDVG